MQYSGILLHPKWRYFARWALLIVRTCWIFQCCILFLGYKNMHLIGMYTWGFCNFCVSKHIIYVVNIDWFFFNCLFSVISSHSSKYAVTTSVSYKYVLLKEGEHLVYPQWNFKIFGNLNNILMSLCSEYVLSESKKLKCYSAKQLF